MATGHQSLHSPYHGQASACSPGGPVVSPVRGAHLQAGRNALLTWGAVVMSSTAPHPPPPHDTLLLQSQLWVSLSTALRQSAYLTDLLLPAETAPLL